MVLLLIDAALLRGYAAWRRRRSFYAVLSS
jgi:hypothetical protein